LKDPALQIGATLAEAAVDEQSCERTHQCSDAELMYRRATTPSAFLLGIARHLLQEEQRRRIRESKAVQEWASTTADSSSRDEDLLRKVEQCLGKLRKEQRELLLAYYRSTGRQKVEHHRELAAGLGVSLNALRNRLMRARKELDDCVRRSGRDVSNAESTRR
jgi:DNA-directed RNA polymerase specialized sigma24 family protein